MSNRSGRHLFSLYGLDQKGIPAFFRPYRRTNVPITTQFYGMRRMRGRTANISATSLYEWTFARTSVVSEQDPALRWSTLGSNVEAYWQRQGLNRLMWQFDRQATNNLLNSTAPANQTTGSLNTGTYVLWLEGTGSVTIAANTGTATGLGTATAAAPIFINVTVAGTFNITVTGSVTRFQLEGSGFNSAVPSSFIPTAGSAVTRTVATFRWLPTQMGSGLLGTAGTLIGHYFAQSTWPTFTAAADMLSVSDGTANNRLAVNMAGSGTALRAQVISGGSVLGTATSTVTPQAGTVYRFGIAWDSTGLYFAHTGMATVQSALFTVAGLNQINMGAAPGGTNAWMTPAGLIARFPVRITNAQLLDAVARA